MLQPQKVASGFGWLPLGQRKEAKMSEPRAIGKVIHYWTRLGVAGVELSGTLEMDDWIRFRGATTDFEQRVTSMQINRRFVSTAGAGQQVGILVADRVRAGDTVILLDQPSLPNP
jgi:hypothetical protein